MIDIYRATVQPGVLVGIDDVKAAVSNHTAQFIDTRSLAEYTGMNTNGNKRGGEFLACRILRTGCCELLFTVVFAFRARSGCSPL